MIKLHLQIFALKILFSVIMQSFIHQIMFSIIIVGWRGMYNQRKIKSEEDKKKSEEDKKNLRNIQSEEYTIRGR